MWNSSQILFLTLLTGPDLQNVKFYPTSIFDIIDRSGPAKMWNFGQFSFLTFLTGAEQLKCGFLANFHFWKFWQVRTCKNVKFEPNFIFDIFNRSGPAKMWISSQLPFLTLLTGPDLQKCEILAKFHFWHF